MITPRCLLVLITATLTTGLYGADAADNWENHCVKCHGAGGQGDTKMGRKLKIRDFSDAAVQAKFTDEDAFKAVKSGLTDDQGKVKMKPIEGLSDDEIKALVTHLRTLKK